MWTLFLHLSDGYLLGMGLWLLLLVAAPVVLVRMRRRWKDSRGRTRVLYVGLSAWICLVPLTLLELGFALLYDTTDSFDMTNVSQRWFDVHVAPDLKQIVFSPDAALSYRSVEQFPLGLPDYEEHVVFLGDSFTFGHGIADVSDRFTDRLYDLQMSRTASGQIRPMLVSNLSWPGTDLLWVEAVLEQIFAADGGLDRVVYVLCLNDIETFHDPRMQRSTELAKFEPPTFLLRDTYFYNWLYFRSQLLNRSDVSNYYDFVQDYYSGEPWQRFQAALLRTQALCSEHGCEFSVVVFPFMHVLGPEYPYRDVHAQIVSVCEEYGIMVIDLEPHLSPHAAAGLTVNRFDAHPNELAHDLAAQVIDREWFQRETAGEPDKSGSLASPKGE